MDESVPLDVDRFYVSGAGVFTAKGRHEPRCNDRCHPEHGEHYLEATT